MTLYLVFLLVVPFSFAQVCDASTYLDYSVTSELRALDITQITVTPSKEQAGTRFTIRANITDLTSIYLAKANITLANRTFTLVLYDDGAHGDNGANDSIFGAIWDSAGQFPGFYDVNVYVVNSIGQEDTRFESSVFELIQGKCVPMRSSGSQEEKLDIVFVPCDYSSGEEQKFQQDVLAPYGKPQQLAGECGDWDTVIVIADSTAWEGCAYLGGVAHSSSSYPWITVHEFGHSLTRLLDEYSYGPSGSTSGPNCDYRSCARWSGMNGTACIPGCNYDNLYRPTSDSTMRTALNQEFGSLNKKIIEEALDDYD